MQVSIKQVFVLLMLPWMLSTSCKKDVEEKEVIDNLIYQVDTTKLYSSSAEKTKQKTPAQYISILYSDLFNTNISSTELSELSELNLAVGDKTMANELTLSHYLRSASVDLPSDAEMRADVESFVEQAYLRFYQRRAAPYEVLYMTDIINKDPELSVPDVYTSFILSNEYYYY